MPKPVAGSKRSRATASSSRDAAPIAAVVDISDNLAPLGPAPSGARPWQPIRLENILSVAGGHQGKSFQTESMDVGGCVFVKVDKNAKWFLKLVGGPSLQKGGLQRTRVIEQLREKCCTGLCVREDAPNGGDDDPMDGLDN